MKPVWIKIPKGNYYPPGPKRWIWVKVLACASYRKAYKRLVRDPNVGRMRAWDHLYVPGYNLESDPSR